MLTICACLNYNRPGLDRADIDERQCRCGVGELLDESTHILRETGTPPFRIKIAEARVQRPDLSRGQVRTHRQIDERIRLSRAELEQVVRKAGVGSRNIVLDG